MAADGTEFDPARFVRQIENKLWQRGGVAAVEQYHRDVKTCDRCGTEAADFWIVCPVCRFDRLAAAVELWKG